MVCALTPFDARCGFRPLAETCELVASLEHPGLRPLEDRLGEPGDDDGVLRSVLSWLLGAPADEAAQLVDALADACLAPPDGPWRTELAWTNRLRALYPGDPGVVVALLLADVQFYPGGEVYGYECRDVGE